MESRKKKILVSVTGMTPQVVTETLYAFVKQGTVPDEIRIITTQNGRNMAVDRLLDDKNGIFHELCRDYGLTGRIRFDESCITVITDKNGNELDDIRTPEDNNCAADVIVEEIRSLCADDDNIVHVSLAGGRKTMGFYIGYALSLFGRSCDTLSHVLVTPKFEGNRDFFYPTQKKFEILDRDGSKMRATDAEIMLAEIPFVRMRDGSQAIVEGHRTFSEYVSSAQNQISDSKRVIIKPEDKTIEFGKERTVIRFDPMTIAVYIFFANRRKSGKPPLHFAFGDIAEFNECLQEFLDAYAKVVSKLSKKYLNSKNKMKTVEDLRDKLVEQISRANSEIRQHMGASAAEIYRIHSDGKRGQMSYGLNNLPPDGIIFDSGL